ncbi:beta-channel forming cytolysin [Clostridium perfringens]|nr:beta-channel forming cytolysin [Clostridium perfringens]
MKSKNLILTSILVGTLTSSFSIFNSTNIKAATIFPEKIIEEKGSKAEVFTAYDASSIGAMKSSVSVSFINDTNNSNATALINVKGFIPSSLVQNGSYYRASMFWPSKYKISVKTSDINDNVKIINTIPSNSIDSVKVKESLGYSIGGNISVSKESSGFGLNGGINIEKSIEYDQPDFKTFQKKDNTREASWDIVFNETKNQYNRDSYHGLYGNQIFMKSRLHNTGDKNLTDEKDLSSLITGGFTPNIAVALNAPKNTKKSLFTVNFNREMDLYNLQWNTTQWFGENKKNITSDWSTHTYELNWEDHTIKFLY